VYVDAPEYLKVVLDARREAPFLGARREFISSNFEQNRCSSAETLPKTCFEKLGRVCGHVLTSKGFFTTNWPGGKYSWYSSGV